MQETSLDHWLSLVLRAFPGGFYYKDLTATALEKVEWGRIATVDDPLVFRLDSARLGAVLQSLMQEGVGGATPCALLQEGADQHSFGAVSNIAARQRALAASKQSLLVVADDLSALQRCTGPQALAGKSVLVTRSSKQAGRLSALLREHGARVLEIPTIEIRVDADGVMALENALRNIKSYGWLILTSVNTVEILDDLLRRKGKTWGLFAGAHIACIGTATAKAVRERGARVALIPPSFQAESLVQALLAEGVTNRRILLPRAHGSREILPVALSQGGAEVNEIHVYKSDVPESSRQQLQDILKDHQIDFLTFTSSSTVHNFVELAGSMLEKINLEKTRIACIGPITAATLKEYGLPPAIQAAEFTIPGLVQAIVESL